MNVNKKGEGMRQESSPKTSNSSFTASFQQKSAGVSLFIVASIAAYYISQAWSMLASTTDQVSIPDGYYGLVITTFMLIILAQVILQVVLVIGVGSATKPSTHEQTAILKARRNAYYILAIGIMVIVAVFFFGYSTIYIVNLAIIALLLAEVTMFASQLLYARQRD